MKHCTSSIYGLFFPWTKDIKQQSVAVLSFEQQQDCPDKRDVLVFEVENPKDIALMLLMNGCWRTVSPAQFIHISIIPPLWASLVAQMVKNPPVMQETWVWTLGWENPLEKGKGTHFSVLAWRSPWTVHGVANSWTRQSEFHSLSIILTKRGHTCDMPQLSTGKYFSNLLWRYHI